MEHKSWLEYSVTAQTSKTKLMGQREARETNKGLKISSLQRKS